MFEVKTKAELKKINLRAEAHGDDWIRAMDIVLMLLDVPVDKISSAVPAMEKRFYKGDEPILQEIFPFQVQHKIENCNAKVSRTTFKGCDIKTKAKVWPKPGKVCNMEIKLQVSDFKDGALDSLSKLLRAEISIEITQRQADFIDEMDQEKEKAA